MKRFKRFIRTTLLGGFIVILPIAILVAVFTWFYKKVTELIQPLTNLVIQSGIDFKLAADLIVSGTILLAFFLVGMLVKTEFGRFIHGFIEERVLKNAPGYNLVKETVLQFLGNKETPFSSVVLARPYNNDTMVTGFVTDRSDAHDFITVFVPTGPNPTSGQIFHIPKENVFFLETTVEEAMRSILSCGAGSKKLLAKHLKITPLPSTEKAQET